jgi:hypothetical protein
MLWPGAHDNAKRQHAISRQEHNQRKKHGAKRDIGARLRVMSTFVPPRVRIAWSTQPLTGTPLALPPRRSWPAGIVVAIMFAVFAGVWCSEVSQLHIHDSRGTFDVFGFLFRGFWLLGWSVGVLILGALTVLVFVARESARLDRGRLVQVLRVGPLSIISERDLARIRNLRLEPAAGGTSGNQRVCFDYDGKPAGIGDAIPRLDAERLLAAIRGAAPAATTAASSAPATAPPRQPVLIPLSPSRMSASALALIAANLAPLAFALAGRLELPQLIVLFWAETAIIGLITIVKIIVVGRWWALLAAPFFAGHFGCFMAVHFLFIYGFFLGGFAPQSAPPVGLFSALWPYLALLAASHLVSFVANFIGQREYADEKIPALMTAPYRRVMVMHGTVIIGGALAMVLQTPAPALALLVALKVAADLRAHWRERSAP